MCDYPMYGPPEPFLCWGLYLARNKRDAIKQAVADPAFDEWVREARGDRVPPFKGLKATLAICPHGCCWGCDHGCAECDREGENWLIETTPDPRLTATQPTGTVAS